MHKFEVGKLFQEGITKYQECMKFGFGESGADMLIFFENPTNKETEMIKTGKLEIAFYERDEIIFMLTKFQGMNWMDAPYSVHLSKPFEFMELSQDTGFGLMINFVDAATGILKAIRYVGLGNKFSLALRTAISKQKQLPFSKETYHKKIQEVYSNYSTDELVRRALHFYKVK